MWNGRKNAIVGLGTLLTFIVLELMAVAASAAVLLSVVMDVDIPFLVDADG